MKIRSAAALLSCLFLHPILALAADGEAIFDPKTLRDDADYAIQGEYVGEVTTDGGTVNVGLQVIAMGDHEFTATAYVGGLPGAGWSRGGPTHSAKGKTVDGVTRLEGENGYAILKDGVATVYAGSDEPHATLKKIVRESSTSGAKPPEGATILFDGSNANAFNNGELVLTDLLLANCSTKEKLGSHSLHVEFRTPFKPKARGQGRGNSGVYIQGRYECQVLDSFGLDGKDNECGGIYKVAEPIVNMCFPPMTWQTYDIDFTQAEYDADGKKTKNARATIRHNGVVIHDNLELPQHTPGRAKEGPGPESLYLQGHGNPVVYRNVWVVKK